MRRGVALALLSSVAVGAVGCSNSLDSLYGEPDTPTGDAGRMRATEPLPALPLLLKDEEQAAACEGCAAKACATERENCLMDDACTALLGCMGECSDPACIRQCYARFGYSQWYDDYLLCAFSERCPTDCPKGDNWECVGEYNWPAAPSSHFEVDFHFTDNLVSTPRLTSSTRTPLFLAGAAVRSCGVVDCSPAFDEDKVRADGHVSLEVDTGTSSQGDWRGYLELDDPDVEVAGVRNRVYGWPVSQKATVRTYFVDPGRFFGVRGHADARLTVVMLDCLGFVAGDVAVELETAEDAAPIEPSTLPNGAMSVGSVDAEVLVRALEPESGDPLAERTVRLSPSWTAWVLLWPRARNE